LSLAWPRSAAIVWLEGAIGHQASEVVAELRYAQAESIAAVHIVQRLELGTGLQSVQDAQLARLAGTRQIVSVVDPHQPLRILGNKAVPLGKQAFAVGNAVCTFSKVDNIDACAPESFKVCLRESAGLGKPFLLQVLLIEAIRETGSTCQSLPIRA
jgi:hypothetical protein